MTPQRHRTRSHAARTYAIRTTVALAAGLLLAGCGAGDESDNGSSAGSGEMAADAEANGSAAAEPEEATPEDSAARSDLSSGLTFDEATSGSAPGGSGSVPDLDLTTAQLDQRDVIRTGTVSLVAEDPQRARDRIGGIVAAANGYVADESARARPGGGIEEVQVVLRVPVGSFDEVVADVSALGDVRSRVLQADDVTSEVADVDSRVQSARAALDRVRALLDRAVSLGSVIRLEGVLSNRQADLEALLARQQALANQTTLATLEVLVDAPEKEEEPPPVEEKDETEGFGEGLGAGWDAMSDAFVVASTVAGALLPWAVLAAVCAVPVLVWRRRRVSPVTPEPTPAE